MNPTTGEFRLVVAVIIGDMEFGVTNRGLHTSS